MGRRLAGQTGVGVNSLQAGPALPESVQAGALLGFAEFKQEFAARFLRGKDSAFVGFWEEDFAEMGATPEELRYSLHCYAMDERREQQGRR